MPATREPSAAEHIPPEAAYHPAELMSLTEASDAMGLPSWKHPAVPRSVTGVAYDSRRVSRGDCFVAVPGGKNDGAEFVREAFARGASVVVTERRNLLSPLPQIVVPSARDALADIAAAFYARRHERVRLAGVTGTNGKTTTAFLLRAMLSSALGKCGMLGTVVNDCGAGESGSTMTTPESLDIRRYLAEMAANRCRYAAIEVSSHALAASRVRGLDFDVAVFTNLSQDHLDFHGTMKEYLKTKAKLFAMLKPGATAVLNADDPAALDMAEVTDARVLHTSLSRSGDVRAENVELGIEGTRFRLVTPWGSREVETHLVGRHNVSNVVSAAAAALSLGVGLESLVEAIEALEGVPGRLERVPGRVPFTVLVDYAHTEDALRKVLGALREVRDGRIITVFGCGGDRDRTKRPRMGRVVQSLSDISVVTSDNPRTEDPREIISEILAGMEAGRDVIVEPEREQAIREAVLLARTGDIVLIAGKGHEPYQVMGERRLPFDDRKVAACALAESASKAA